MAETETTEQKSPKMSKSAGGTRADIDAGICGFHTSVTAQAESMRKVNLTIESECPQIRKAAELLPQVDMLEELKAGMGKGKVYEILSPCVKHVTCPVGSGILKAAEAAAGLALPKDVTIKMSKV